MPTLAFVGTAHIHTPGFVKRFSDEANASLSVKYVWDHDLARAKANAETLGADVADDIATITADSTIDAIVICAETDRHLDLVRQVAPSEKAIFVEKPLGLNGEHSLAMADQFKQYGNAFSTGYFMRTDPKLRFIKSAIEKEHFGTITKIAMSNCHSGALNGIFDTDWRWMADPAQCGYGGFGDLGFHALDIMLWFMGDADRVTATTDTVSKRYGDIDEFGQGIIEFGNGANGQLTAGWVSHQNPVSLQIDGTEGSATIFNGELYFSSTHVEKADGSSPWTDLPAAAAHPFQAFLDHVKGDGEAMLIPADEVARVDVVMEALYHSAASGEFTPVNPVAV